ncbi:hypothetical protein MKEN_00394400 [Mycena kentingensis (nom. inval.)]|nr:hypothetical protein MKEN_00394400 [Mycena kentingensis (nom. inval.)]
MRLHPPSSIQYLPRTSHFATSAIAMPQTAPSATYRQSPLPESASTSADPSPPPADVEIDGYASDITEDAADFFADDEEDAADEWYDDDLNNLPTPSPTPAACSLPIASTPLQPTVVSDSPPVRKRRRLAEPVLVTRARKAAAATAARQAALREVQGTLRSERRVLELAGGHEGLLAKRLRSVESTLRLILDGQKQGMMSASKIAALAHGFSAMTGSRLVQSWTQSWVRDRAMPVSRRGQHSKVSSIFDDPAVCEAVRAYVRTNKWAMDPGKLKKLVNNELDPKTAKEYAKEITETEMPVGLREYVEKTLLPRLQLKRTGHGFSLSTMCRVLAREGFTYTLHKKAVYYDGHERPDVVADRMERFIPAMEAIRPFITKYEVGNVDNEIRPNGRQHILCAHDEMTAQAHDGKKASWVFEGQQPLLKKGVGRGHHRSEFINSVDGHMAEAGVGLDYGKNHEGFWNGELFVKQVQEKFIPAFEQRHPGAVAVLLVDNSQGRSAYPKDALRASQMNFRAGGAQPKMRDGWYLDADGRKHTQPMVFPENDPRPTLRGKPKGMQQVLKERGLWRRGLLMKCSSGCEDGRINCCGLRILENQADFKEQRSLIQEVPQVCVHEDGENVVENTSY